jgi:hypothetical protein
MLSLPYDFQAVVSNSIHPYWPLLTISKAPNSDNDFLGMIVDCLLLLEP